MTDKASLVLVVDRKSSLISPLSGSQSYLPLYSIKVENCYGNLDEAFDATPKNFYNIKDLNSSETRSRYRQVLLKNTRRNDVP